MISLKIVCCSVAAGCLAVTLWSFPVAAEAGQSLPKIICGPGAGSLHSRWSPTFNLAQETISAIDRETAEVEGDEAAAGGRKERSVDSGDDVKVNMDDDSAQLVLRSRNGVSPFLDAGMGGAAAGAVEEDYGTALVRSDGPSVYRLGAGIGCVLDPAAKLNFGYHFATSEEPTTLERLTGDAGGNDEEHKISVDLKVSF